MNSVAAAVATLVLAFLAESMTEYILAQPLRKYVKDPADTGMVLMYAGLVSGIALAFLFDLDLFAWFLELKAVNHAAAVVLTGLVLGRGANYTHDLLKRLTAKPFSKEDGPAG